jgi:hypothetical protein
MEKRVVYGDKLQFVFGDSYPDGIEKLSESRRNNLSIINNWGPDSAEAFPNLYYVQIGTNSITLTDEQMQDLFRAYLDLNQQYEDWKKND